MVTLVNDGQGSSRPKSVRRWPRPGNCVACRLAPTRVVLVDPPPSPSPPPPVAPPTTAAPAVATAASPTTTTVVLPKPKPRPTLSLAAPQARETEPEAAVADSPAGAVGGWVSGAAVVKVHDAGADGDEPSRPRTAALTVAVKVVDAASAAEGVKESECVASS